MDTEITYTNCQEIAYELLKLAPVDIEKAIRSMPQGVAQSVERALDGIAERATLFAAYLQYRKGTDGCGEREVYSAVKQAMKRMNKVSKALGYHRTQDFSSAMTSGILDRKGEDDG